jgi:hypothetical protein
MRLNGENWPKTPEKQCRFRLKALFGHSENAVVGGKMNFSCKVLSPDTAFSENMVSVGKTPVFEHNFDSATHSDQFARVFTSLDELTFQEHSN